MKNMNKKVWILIAALAVLALGLGAYAATHLVVKAQPEMAGVNTEVKTDEGTDMQTMDADDAAGEEIVEIFDLSGKVIEVGEGFFVIDAGQMGAVQVNTGDDTIFEGVTMEEIALGQYVQVLYDGKMTRSLPAQIYALKVGMYAISGEVKAAEEGSITLLRDEIGDEVIVFLPEGAQEIAVGSHVIAYTNGAMTMSLPAQTTALGIALQ